MGRRYRTPELITINLETTDIICASEETPYKLRRMGVDTGNQIHDESAIESLMD